MLLKFLFPKECFSCSKNGYFLCPACKQRLKTIHFQVCPVCLKSNFLGRTHNLCSSPKSLDGVFCLFYYRSFVGKMVKSLKYYHLKEVKDTLVDIVVSNLKKQTILSYWQKNDFSILSIPLFPARFLWRGFNQSQVLAQGVGDKLGLEVLDEDVLIRTRWTLAQAGLEAERRKRNLKNVFTINDKKAIKGKRIIIFDDVWTTGATLKEAAKILKFAGAKEVWGLVICR